MKGGIEYGHLRCFGEYFFSDGDTHEVSRVVQWRQRDKRLYFLFDFIRNNGRFG